MSSSSGDSDAAVDGNSKSNENVDPFPGELLRLSLPPINSMSFRLPKEVHFIAEAEMPRSETSKVKRFELEARLRGDSSSAT